MTYTIKNLAQTKDSAPEFGLAEIGEAHFPRDELDAEATGLAYYVIKPGKRQAFGHRHENAEEIYLVLDGAGRIRLDDAIEGIGPFDAIRVAPSVTRALEAGPDGMTIVVLGARHASDGEMLNDFWND
jgi:mannose-6-phosphate isomerase-like protein (cupin superfamily)